MRTTFHYPESPYGRTYADVITKISRMDSLPNYLSYGAPLSSGIHRVVIDRLTICVKNTLIVTALSLSNLDERPSRPVAFDAFTCTNCCKWSHQLLNCAKWNLSSVNLEQNEVATVLLWNWFESLNFISQKHLQNKFAVLSLSVINSPSNFSWFIDPEIDDLFGKSFFLVFQKLRGSSRFSSIPNE